MVATIFQKDKGRSGASSNLTRPVPALLSSGMLRGSLILPNSNIWQLRLSLLEPMEERFASWPN
jgi:hypothetical protein